MKEKFTKGFTLIELLVVISIIGILATIAIVSYTGAQKQARDIERKSDLKQYQTALEGYANKNNGLYVAGSGDPANMCTALTGSSNCPKDPKAGTSGYGYNYQSDSSGVQYVLWAKLENISTTTYWIVCSNGKSGQVTTGIPPTGGACPT